MKSLLWRDYRLNSLIVIVGAVLLLVPYAFSTIVVVWPRETEISGHDIEGTFALAAVLSCWLSQLTVAFLGGNAFAGERADRSTEFMSYLPVSRKQRLVSKLILSAIVIGVAWTINMAVVSALHDFILRVFLEAFGLVAATGIVMFGVGWLISALQSSPTFAICGGIATPMVTIVGLWTVYSVGERIAPEAFESIDYERNMGLYYAMISLTLGVIGFTVGTRHYLKRVEP